MAKIEKRRYFDAEEIDDIYKTEFDGRKHEFLDTATSWDDIDKETRERVEKVIVKRVQAMPRLEDEDIEKLRIISPQIVGSLFDRVKFLKERVEETQNTMKDRTDIHNDMISEINEDIKERNGMLGKAMNIDEQRSIKLDISVLRKEKRKEVIQLWRDMFDLRTELKELLEQFQNEQKLADLFKDIKSNTGKED
ncbi:MAG: hypothetical protein KKB03_02975 [Nanoarchaeota archaeon]|nr:hypothetical protein [Nanoarchaeota archaeon]MBU1135020.1 hypothetical protein [Nanoarchaeota archaeon]MBU2520178.1 hypothetical protein [Nanoarchaeota archaeon]